MKRNKKRKTKSIYLSGGSVHAFTWQLYLSVSDDQQEWSGNFTLSEAKKINKHRTIYLGGGSEENCGWKLYLNAVFNQRNWLGCFYFENETEKYRNYRRTNDNQWVVKLFPQRWLQQFEIHHDWKGGEVCYFLTPKEHREQDRILRDAPHEIETTST
jgi:hypothetical protein